MRQRVALWATTLLAAATAVVAVQTAVTGTARAVAAVPYTWNNVAVHGGGFVPGIVFNKGRRDLVYARTDIGGAYRWNPTTRRWIPLNDFTAPNDWNLLGIDALATDAVDPNRLYLLAGTYTQSWAGNAAILRSTDQGATFTRTDLPFKAGGNENGRSMGERLVIDPVRNNVLYLGTRTDGLWRSTDFGASWARVASFPATGQSGIGIAWIEFDRARSAVYVGVGGGTTTPVYRSTDGGTTWAPVPGQPNAGLPHHGRVSGGSFYVTYGDQPGPYTMSNGSVWKLGIATGTWTDITPLRPWQNGEPGFGYAGLAVDAANPDTVMVATMGRWGPVDDIFRSTNGGATWTSVTARKVMDTSAAPYLNWHGTPKLGWMIGSLEIDPFNPDRFLYGTGATIFGTDQARVLDSPTGTVTITSRAHGLEETAVQDLISPPSGAPLISALGDIGVYRHDDLSVVPPNGMATNPIYGTASSLDYAELAPAQMISAGAASPPDRRVSFSADGGRTWAMPASEPENPEGMGTVAIAADGSAAVWSPNQRGVFFTTNRGASWTASSGISGQGVAVRSDRVDPTVFYAFLNGTFYVSTNRGASFTATASGLPTGSTYFKAVPGHTRDVWLTTGYGGLYRSTGGGAFARNPAVTEAFTVGFGRAAPGRTYPAVYLNGIIDGVNGLFRSDDAGASWVRINDDAHQYGWIGKTITGDPRVYGRVYVSTNGRGIIYGDPTGGPPSSPPASSRPPSSAPPSSGPPSSRPPSSGPPSSRPPSSAPPGSGCRIGYAVNEWPGAFQAEVRVTNTGTAPVPAWTLRWTFTAGQQLSQSWGATYTQTGADVAATNVSYTAPVPAGGSVTFGFIASWSGSNPRPAAFTLNGVPCAVT